MARFSSVLGLVALVSALLVAASIPARAEFWRCDKNRDRGKVLYSYTGSPDRYSGRYTYARTPSWTTHQRVSQSRAYYGSSHTWNGRSRW
jgi:hypothetical protein